MCCSIVRIICPLAKTTVLSLGHEQQKVHICICCFIEIIVTCLLAVTTLEIKLMIPCYDCGQYNHTYLNIKVFWDVAPGSLVVIDRRFRGGYCLHRPNDGGSMDL
jgi:hypothetical protein